MRAAWAALAAGLVLLNVPPVSASPEDPWRSVPWKARIQVSAEESSPSTVHESVKVPGATWLRLVFGEVSLGPKSYVRIRSLRDGGEQQLDATAMAQWSNSSAVFNGDEVEVELVRGEGDTESTLDVVAVLAGEPPALTPQTICGTTDDRVPSSDNRVGRIRPGGCTAWQIGNGAMLTAGHCVDFDPDQGGPMLPDGVIDLSGVVEFNVPASDASGNLVASAPADQFPVNLAGIQWRFDGTGQGLGKDWGVFRVNANADGQLPHQRYGAPFRIMRELPSSGTTLRVTGFGTDDGTANQTNQTHTGPYGSQSTSGSDVWISHSVDTQGGNSGSPVLWDAVGVAVAIHTNGGCTDTGGTNFGTSFDVIALRNAIDGFPGALTVHVDAGHPIPGIGSLVSPRSTLSAAVSQVSTGGILSVFPGTYSLTAGTVITKAMTIQAPVGTVVVQGN